MGPLIAPNFCFEFFFYILSVVSIFFLLWQILPALTCIHQTEKRLQTWPPKTLMTSFEMFKRKEKKKNLVFLSNSLKTTTKTKKTEGNAFCFFFYISFKRLIHITAKRQHLHFFTGLTGGTSFSRVSVVVTWPHPSHTFRMTIINASTIKQTKKTKVLQSLTVTHTENDVDEL